MRGCKARSLCVDIVVLQYQAQLEECHLIGIFSMMEDEREREGGRSIKRLDRMKEGFEKKENITYTLVNGRHHDTQTESRLTLQNIAGL